jgi:glutathione S-transferase
MQLVGMPDSPYVRRVAVTLKLMDLPFEHQEVSVFRHFERFAEINPVVKAPTLVCDDGTVLMDSTLICDYLEAIAPDGRSLMPKGVDGKREVLRLTGLALAAAEKCVQVVYERDNRPADKRHMPWLERVVLQANTAFDLLEGAASYARPWLLGPSLTAADVVVACAWRFGQFYNAAEVPAGRYPGLVSFSGRAEALPAFASTPLR